MKNTKRIAQLEAMLDQHDCHASPEDGCPCGELRAELAELKEAKND